MKQFLIVQEQGSTEEFQNILKGVFKETIREIIREEKLMFSASDTTKEEDKPVSINELAKDMKVTRQTIHAWVKEGKIPSHMIGSRRYFYRSEIKTFLLEKKKY